MCYVWYIWFTCCWQFDSIVLFVEELFFILKEFHIVGLEKRHKKIRCYFVWKEYRGIALIKYFVHVFVYFICIFNIIYGQRCWMKSFKVFAVSWLLFHRIRFFIYIWKYVPRQLLFRNRLNLSWSLKSYFLL